MTFKEIIKKSLAWRLLLFLPAIVALLLIPYRHGYSLVHEYFSWSNFALMWSNFDGIHYIDIARYGYGAATHTDKSYAFFPVYPYLVSLFSIFNSQLLGGLIVSHLSLILAVYYLFKLVSLDHGPKIAKLTLLLMAVFPTAFFFGSVYSESVFLLTVVLSLYFARKKSWWLAAIFASVASATKITGVILWPTLLIEYIYENKITFKKIFQFKHLWILIPPVGLLLYMNLQFMQTGDPLYFVHSQSAFQAGREVDKIILPHQVVFRYLKMMIFVDHTTPLFFSVLQEFLTGILFMLLSVIGIFKLRKSYAFFCAASYIVPTFTGTFLSMPRFVLILFPLFVLIAIYLNKRHILKLIYFVVCTVFASITIALFTRGYFIG